MIPVFGDVTTTRPTVRSAVAVAVGGVVGACGRWGIGELLGEPGIPAGWPWATLIVNVSGCLAIGVAARRVARSTLAWDALVTGVLGGFTTMSAFAVELNEFADHGRIASMVAYGTVTVTGGLGAVLLADRAAARSTGGGP